MLKRGHVYKAIFDRESGYFQGKEYRNYILFSPSEDTMNKTLLNGGYLNTIFLIGLLGIYQENTDFGIHNLKRITTEFTDFDISEIEDFMNKHGWKYDRKLKRIEKNEKLSYESNR